MKNFIYTKHVSLCVFLLVSSSHFISAEEVGEPKNAISSLNQPEGHDAKMLETNEAHGQEMSGSHSSTVKYHTNNSTSGNQSDHHGDDEGHTDHGGHDRIHLVEINFEHVKNPLVFGLVVIIAGLSKIGFHHANFLSSKVPESCILILLGVVLGAIIHFSGIAKNMEFFAPHEFFLYLLPPIILEAAFSLHDRTFSENIGSIIMFSVVGTIIACFAIGFTLLGLNAAGAMEDTGCSTVQLLVFSALIVAVDPVAVLAIFQEVGVNNMLYFIVFGESLLNDGVTVVLYNVMQTYNRMDTIGADQVVLGIVKFFVVVFGGIALGVIHGLLSSFLTKFTNSVKVVEPIIIFGFAYQSYILSEMFHFSGIVSIIACGLTQMQYAFNNITNKSKLAVKFFAKVMSNTCEIIIFLFLGLKVVNPNHSWNTGFVLWTTLLCIVYRFIIVFVMSILINRCDKYRVRKIKLDEMFMISYGGLRGAVCFSLVALLDEREFPMKDMFVTTTLFVIFFTVFVQGGTIKWLVKKMRVSLQSHHKDMILYMELNQHVSDHVMAGIEEIVGQSGKYYLREKFDRADDNFIKPIFLRDPKKCGVDEINQYYEKLMMKEHYKNLQLCGVKSLPHVSSDLRSVDSSGCLKVMGDEFEQRELENDEKIRDKRGRLQSQKSLKDAETEEGLDLRKLFRSALIVSKITAGVKYHDKNFVSDDRRQLVGNLRHKYKKNQRLSTYSRPTFDRAFSVNENDTSLCVRRTSDVKLNRVGGRSKTVDFTTTPTTPPAFSLEDTVFEDTEQKENEPLIEKTGRPSENKHVHVHFTTDPDLNNDIIPQDTKSKENGRDQAVNSKNVQQQSLNEKGRGKPEREETTHAQSHLFRQDAVKDADIPMQDLGPQDMDKKTRKMSI